MLCLWWAALAAALGAGARAQRPRPVCPRDQGPRCVTGGYVNDFIVNGTGVSYSFVNGKLFDLDCRGISLDEPALPRFEPALRVRQVKLYGCWPRAGSYAAALSALNVTAYNASSPGADPTYYIELILTNVKNFDATVLAAMPTLRSLNISDTTVTSVNLALLPVGLERLVLRNTRTGRVPAAALARLPRLRTLTVNDTEPMDVEAAGNLSSLSIYSPDTLVSLSLPDTLGSLELWNWAPRRPEPWRSCAGLGLLVVKTLAAETLPDGWLARCTNLHTLQLDGAKELSTLSAGTLRGATALENVLITDAALEALPAGLLDDAPALRDLGLSSNRLHTLPGDLFMGCKSLSWLDLSFNQLNSSVLGVLGGATSLSWLDLSGNTALDACHSNTQESSPWSSLKSLTLLWLHGTGTRSVCSGWRQLPRLGYLVLFDTNITRLNYTDLQLIPSTVDITVYLSVVGISLRREDYESAAAAAAAPGPVITLLFSSSLRCDCELYWAAAAMRLPGTRLRDFNAFCEDRRILRDVPLEELVCAAPGPCLAGCTCVTREHSSGRVLRLDCTRKRLTSVPRLDPRAALQYTGAEPVALELGLVGNYIDGLAPEDLPPELTVLDLSYNYLRVFDEATMAALVSRADRRVLLAGNRLDCTCPAAAALAIMRAHTDVFRDWDDLTCSDGRWLALPRCDDDGSARSEPEYATESVPGSTTEFVLQYTTTALTPERVTVDTTFQLSTTPAPESVGKDVSVLTLVAAVVAGMLALVLAVTVAVQRRRLRAQRTQLPQILQLRRRRPESGEWAYDVFVSFAHADEAIAHELVSRLEGGEAPLRVCVHYRDWMPGGWIPAQIAASVRVSRRTVALVSEAFLRSKWARAEFREAYAAAVEDTEPRLVLVLLQDPERLQLDSELAAYVSGITYVRWGDPWIWRKLRSALPGPSVRPAAESAAASTSVPPGRFDAAPK